MPSIGFGELIVILLFALMIFGPKRLPQIGRSMGNALREFRRSAADFRAELEDDIGLDERPTFPKATGKKSPASAKTTDSQADDGSSS